MHKVFAQPVNITGDYGISFTGQPNFRFANIGQVIFEAVPIIFLTAGIGAFLMFIAAGYGFLTSAGDSKKTEAAKHQLTNAVLGLILIITAYWIVQVVGRIFGIQEIIDVFQ